MRAENKNTAAKLTYVTVCVCMLVFGLVLLFAGSVSAATGNATPGGGTIVTEDVWPVGTDVSENLIPTPTLPGYSSEAGADKELWQEHWNQVMVPYGWGSDWISGEDDALQVYIPESTREYAFAIRPVDVGTDGTNACLGGAGDAPDKYTGGISYTVELSEMVMNKANEGKLKTMANGYFYREEGKEYHQAITVEFLDEGGNNIGGSLQERWHASKGAVSGYLKRSFAEMDVPAGTKYIRYWFSNNGSGDTRKAVADPAAYLVDTSIHVCDYTSGICSCGSAVVSFESESVFTLSVSNSKKNWSGTIEYSTDLSSWQVWGGTEAISSSSDGKLYLRGSGNTYITGEEMTSSASWLLDGSDIFCSGNIMTLLDYRNTASAVMAEYAFIYMFIGCSAMISAPELPATTLSSHCYYGMFDKCTGLIYAPELPAVTLAPYCYYDMFDDCTALSSAPELPAMILTENCYTSMFSGCTALEYPPELPATVLADACYTYMFQNCTGLVALPDLPDAVMAAHCYQNMFRNCTGIKLSETALVDSKEWRFPSALEGSTGNSTAWASYMLVGTSGSFTGTPALGGVYYQYGEHVCEYDSEGLCVCGQVMDTTGMHKITVSADVGGTASGGGFVDAGGSMTVTAVAEQYYYKFAGWYKDDILVSESEIYTIENISESAAYTARFSPLPKPAIIADGADLVMAAENYTIEKIMLAYIGDTDAAIRNWSEFAEAKVDEIDLKVYTDVKDGSVWSMEMTGYYAAYIRTAERGVVYSTAYAEYPYTAPAISAEGEKLTFSTGGYTVEKLMLAYIGDTDATIRNWKEFAEAKVDDVDLKVYTNVKDGGSWSVDRTGYYAAYIRTAERGTIYITAYAEYPYVTPSISAEGEKLTFSTGGYTVEKLMLAYIGDTDAAIRNWKEFAEAKVDEINLKVYNNVEDGSTWSMDRTGYYAAYIRTAERGTIYITAYAENSYTAPFISADGASVVMNTGGCDIEKVMLAYIGQTDAQIKNWNQYAEAKVDEIDLKVYTDISEGALWAVDKSGYYAAYIRTADQKVVYSTVYINTEE